MNERLRKLLKLHKLMDSAGDGGSDAGGTGTGGAAAGGGDPAPKEGDPAPKEGDDPAPKDGGAPKPTDAEANLLRDVMRHKGRANQLQGELEALRKQFDGVDAAKYREFLAGQEQAERKKLEDRGEYDRLVAQMGERHTQAMQEQSSKLDAATQTIAGLQSQISELTVGNAFASTPVIGGEVLMTRKQARTMYGSNFDFVDGKVVGFDKPAGASERTMLVTAAGEPMGFNEALVHLVNTDSDPERDTFLRSKAKPGAGSATAAASSVTRKSVATREVPMTPAERIAAGLRKAAMGVK